ncbi:hypothetical protein BH09PLA1_BH09PLA1_22650 [soil metagenome]
MSHRLLQRFSKIDNIENHTFFPQSLSTDSVVIDLGANLGRFSTAIARRYGLRCFGVEPNPALFEQLRPHNTDRLQFFHFAINGSDGPIVLNVSGEITTSSVITAKVPDAKGQVEVPGKMLGTFLREQGISGVDVLKVDIEGAEVGMFDSLSDESLRKIRQITIEFHDHHGFITREQMQAIRRRLRDLGFHGIKFSPNNTNWLFFQPEVAGPLRRFYVKYIVRNIRGPMRRLGFRYD